MVIYFFFQNPHLNIAEERERGGRYFIVSVQFTMKQFFKNSKVSHSKREV